MKKRNFIKQDLTHIGLIVVLSFVFSLLIQVILPVGDFWKGTLAGFSLLLVVLTLLYVVWRASGGGKTLAWMMIAAFLIRLGLGIFLNWGLPRFGYDVEPQQAGFVFQDAYQREGSAWELAQSGEPLLNAFSDDYETDQYGGLLAMDAFVYRYVSPDAFRPVLILILTSGAFALSLPFTTGILGRLFGKRAALWGGWVQALYPEGILLGAAQMREPFLILFLSILTWSTIQFLDRKRLKLALVLFLGSIISLMLFSIRVGVPIIGVILAVIWVMESARIKKPWVKAVIWIAILGVIVGLGLIYQDWLREVVAWDARLTLIASGRIQYELEALPSWLHLPFIIFYGILQPVLPAAVAAPAPWIWRGLAIFRSLGWYVLLPLLAYAFIRMFTLPTSRKKRLLLIMIMIVWVWILIASARAGGDQWDNPRYRTIFLPWMAVIVGWAVNFAKEKKDCWLGRALVIEGIFLAFFTEWYISRYYPVIHRLDFWLMILLILSLSLAVIIFGWLRDKKRA
jgi:hypothetical protein